MRFGHGGLVGLDFQPEAGVDSWLDHRDAGRCPGDGMFARLFYWLRLNVAHNYINGLRKASNDPAFMARMARAERWLLDPWTHGGAHGGAGAPVVAHGGRALAADYHVERGVLSPQLLGAMRDELMHQNSYHDPAIPGWVYRGRVDAAPYPTLYMDAHALFASDTFLAICANRTIMDFCRDVLGPRAAISWGWAWINNPGYLESPKWKWHRNNAEPFNALLILVPLDDVTAPDHGPMMLIPGSSTLREFYEPRLYADEELGDLQRRQPAGMVLTEVGDVGFVNPFSLHRMMPPHRRQRMLMLMVSIGPSHRSPAIRRRRLADLPGDLRETVAANRRFFHRLVC
jgi:hypothetical protein